MSTHADKLSIISFHQLHGMRMDIISLLEQAGFKTEVREKWTAVFDRRPEFRAQFDTPRIGKVQNGRFYITPFKLSHAAETLITGAGHELHRLPSSSGSRDVVYPGLSITGRSEQELGAFVAVLRNVVNSHINRPLDTKITGLSDLAA
jgi:hypothetical protein